MMDRKEIEDKVADYIRSNFYISDKFKKLDRNLSLMDTGIIDSTGILEIIDYLEENFQISIENSEIIPQNLDSIENICSFIVRKRSQ